MMKITIKPVRTVTVLMSMLVYLWTVGTFYIVFYTYLFYTCSVKCIDIVGLIKLIFSSLLLLFSSLLFSSLLFSYLLFLSCLVLSCLLLSSLISCLSCLVSLSHLISSYLILSHLILPYLLFLSLKTIHLLTSVSSVDV